MTNKKLSDALYAACALAIDWRDGRRAWPSVVRTMIERGWYGLAEREGRMVAYMNGVRFEL